MKIRSGFVSNSSSSSFVIFGYDIESVFPENDEAHKKALIRKYDPNMLEEENVELYGFESVWLQFLYRNNFGIEGVSYLSDDGPGYIGVVLADVGSGDYLEKSETSLKDLFVKINALRTEFEILDEPKIIVGTRST